MAHHVELALCAWVRRAFGRIVEDARENGTPRDLKQKLSHSSTLTSDTSTGHIIRAACLRRPARRRKRLQLAWPAGARSFV